MELLFEEMSETLFVRRYLYPGMASALDEMIDKLLTGENSSYSNSAITSKVKNHPSTQTFIDVVKKQLNIQLQRNGGRLKLLELDLDNMGASALNYEIESHHTNPAFSTWYNRLVNGQTITLNDTHGSTVSVENTMDYYYKYINENRYDRFTKVYEDKAEFQVLSRFLRNLGYEAIGLTLS